MPPSPDRAAALAALFAEEELRPATLDAVIAQESFGSKLRQCPALFGRPFHALDREAQDAIVLRRLQQMFNSLTLNPLWRERIHAAGVGATPRSFEEWQQLPITDRDTLHGFFMGKQREGLVVPLVHGGFEVVASGGTSGGLPIETVYSQRELHDTYEIAGHFMGTFVLPRFLQGELPRWIITTLTDYEMWSSGTMIGGLLQRTPGVNFVAAGPMSEMVYQHIMAFSGPKAIMGMSRELEGLIELGRNLPQDARASFRLAIYGSGVMQRKNIEELQTLYPQLQIISYFASNQAEAIGVQLQPGAPLTSVPGLHLLEIVDDNGKSVAVGEEGELVVTRLHAKEAPVIRMQLGDRMIRRPDYCSDGLVAEQFEFAGRSSDILHLGESQYAARPVYAALCEVLHAAGYVDIDALAHAVQLQNDRGQKILHLLVAMDHAQEHAQRLQSGFGEARLRECLIQALKKSLPYFDQTQKHFQMLENTAYRLVLKFVASDSVELYRTRVGKVPLIRDIL